MTTLPKLGRLPRDPSVKVAKLADAVTAAKVTLPPTPPASVNWYGSVGSWPMDGNDTVGDCTIAAQAHTIQAWTAACGSQVVIPQADVLAKYSALSGWDGTPGDASDVGLVITRVLADWQTNGLDGHKLSSYAQIDVKNHNEIMNAVNWFGTVYIGLNLPVSLQSVIVGNLQPAPLSVTWDVVAGDNSVERSWGGHAVPVQGYNSIGPIVVSWGALYQMTWAFWDAYVDEAYALISADFIEATGNTPAGLTLAQLQADMTSIGETVQGPSDPLVTFVTGQTIQVGGQAIGAMLAPDVILSAPGLLSVGPIVIGTVSGSVSCNITAVQNEAGFSIAKLSAPVPCDHYAGYNSTFTGGVAQVAYYAYSGAGGYDGKGASYNNFTVSGNTGTITTSLQFGKAALVFEESPAGNGINIVGTMTNGTTAYIFGANDINALEEYFMDVSDCTPAIQRLYIGLLGRPAVQNEDQWYTDNGFKAAYNSFSGTPSALSVLLANMKFVTYFVSSAEFTNKNSGYGAADPTAFVNYIYATAFGRVPAASEVSYWNSAIGSLGYNTCIAYITQSAEAIQFSSVNNVG